MLNPSDISEAYWQLKLYEIRLAVLAFLFLLPFILLLYFWEKKK